MKLTRSTIAGCQIVHATPAQTSFPLHLIIFPGLGSTADIYNQMQAKLAIRGFESSAATLINPRGTVMNLDIMQQRMMAITKEIKGPFIAIGHSAGALAMLDLACNTHWENLRGAVGMTCSAYKGQRLGLWAQLALTKYAFDVLRDKDVQLNYKDMEKYMFTGMSPKEVVNASAQMGSLSTGVLKELGKKIEFPRCKASMPCLIIGGEEDVVNPMDRQELIAEKIGADFRTYPGPHMVPLSSEQHLAQLVRTIDEWLREKFPQ